eukprot:2115534-Heterocapsa_arctica.AAC.1
MQRRCLSTESPSVITLSTWLQSLQDMGVWTQPCNVDNVLAWATKLDAFEELIAADSGKALRP